jgi:hypothetical protein
MVMASLLRDPGTYDFDIIAIQEPWKNPYTATTHHPAKDTFHLCYPTGDTEGSARVCFFVNKKIGQTRWRFEERTRDICSIVIDQTDDQQSQERVVIHNVYNPPKTSSNRQSVLPQVREALEHHQTNEQVLLGDFNLHHPLWGGLNREVTDPESEDLIDIIENFALHKTLLPGAVTYEGRAQSTIDLCLVTAGLINRIVSRDDQAEGNLHSAHAEQLGQLYLGRPAALDICYTHAKAATNIVYLEAQLPLFTG